jgi:hypothetical protein
MAELRSEFLLELSAELDDAQVLGDTPDELIYVSCDGIFARRSMFGSTGCSRSASAGALPRER